MIRSYEFTSQTPRNIGSWGMGADLTIAACSTAQTWSSDHWADIVALFRESKGLGEDA